MKKFNSIVDAIREVRNRSKFLDEHNEIYLASNYWGEGFYVTNDALDLSAEIEKDYHESAYDSSPEHFSDEWKVFEYVLETKKKMYPATYRNAKVPSFKSNTALVRQKVQITPEYAISFNIR